MKNTKRYLLVIDQVSTGGAEKILLDFHEYLVAQGFLSEIFVLYGNQSDCNSFHYGMQSNNNNILMKAIQQLYIYVKLLVFCIKYQPHKIFSFLERSNILVACLPIKVSKCISVHNVLSIQYLKIQSSYIKSFIYKLIKLLYNSSNLSQIVAVSQQVKDDLVDEFFINPTKITVINNYVDKSELRGLCNHQIDELDLKDNHKYILSIGRFSDQKAQWKLIRAMSYIVYECHKCNIDLILIGRGENEKLLRELIQDYKLEKHIYILDYNSNPYKFMSRCDLFVLSSLYEGFPIVLAEVAALGVSFVGSTKAIPVEMIDSKEEWTNITYQNKVMDLKRSDELNEDEIELALLLLRRLDSPSSDVVCRKWNKYNDKENQFKKYISILDDSRE